MSKKDKVIKVGSKVQVNDPGLKAQRDVMRKITGEEPEPNHYGVVQEIWDDTDPKQYLVLFDDLMSAPYPEGMVELRG